MAMVMTLKVVNCYDGDGGDDGPSGDMMDCFPPLFLPDLPGVIFTDPSSLQKYSCPSL